MDSSKFINSKDIRNHLVSTGYVFTTLETAWLIFQCNHITLQDKHAAWQELIDSMPDCQVAERPNCKEIKSIHQYLTDYIALQNKYLDLFRQVDIGWIYQLRSCFYEDDGWINEERCFSSLSLCLEYVNSKRSDSIRWIITKRKLDARNRLIQVEYERGNRIVDLFVQGSPEEDIEVDICSLYGLWFNFPTPFQKGDIIWNPSQKRTNFMAGPIAVLGAGLGPSNESNEALIKNHLENGDNTDMNVWGYFASEEGTVYQEVDYNYMDYEYYRGELPENAKILQYVSAYLKDELSLEMLLKTYHYLCDRLRTEASACDAHNLGWEITSIPNPTK